MLAVLDVLARLFWSALEDFDIDNNAVIADINYVRQKFDAILKCRPPYPIELGYALGVHSRRHGTCLTCCT